VVFGRALTGGRRGLCFKSLVFEPIAVVAGDTVLDLAASAFHAADEFLLSSFVPLPLLQ
jgi:hypothetical protein